MMEPSDDANPPPLKRSRNSGQTQKSVPTLAGDSSPCKKIVVETLCQKLHEMDHYNQASALKEIRRHMSSKKDDLIEILIKSGTVPFLIQLLQTNNHATQIDAAWILSNIATQNFEQAKIIVAGGALPVLMNWLASPNIDMLNYAIQIIRTIVDTDDSNEVKALIIKQHIDMLALMILHSNQQIKTNAICIFHNVISANMQYIDEIIQTNAVLFLIQLLSQPNIDILKSVLRALKSFLENGAYTCAYCDQNGILEPLLSHTKCVEPDTLHLVVSTINIFCRNYGSKLLPEDSMKIFRRMIPLVSNSNAEVYVPALETISCFSAHQINGFSIPPHVYERFVYLINTQEIFVQSAALQAFACIINWCYSQMTAQMVQNTVAIMKVFLQQHDLAIQENALCFVIKVVEDPKKIELILSANLLQNIVQLFHSSQHVIGMLSANCVKKISAGTRDQLEAVVQAHCIGPLINLSTSVSLDVRLAALGALANISLHHRDACLCSNIVHYFKISWSKENNPNLVRELARLLFNLLQDPLPPQYIVYALLHYLLHFVKRATTVDDIIFSSKTFSSVARAYPDVIQTYVCEKIVSKLMNSLKHSNNNVQKATLGMLECLSSTNEHKQHLFACGVLQQVTLFLKHSNENINLNGLSVLSKLATGTCEIQAILDEENLILLASNFLKNKSLAVKQETIKFFSTMATNANVQQLLAIFNTGLLTSWFEFMKQDNSEAGILILMLQTFLDICKKVGNAESNLVEFRQRFFASNGQLALYKLYSNGNKQIGTIIYGCISALNIPLSSVTNIPKIT